MKKTWICLLTLAMGVVCFWSAGAEQSSTVRTEISGQNAAQSSGTSEDEWVVLTVSAGKDTKPEQKEEKTPEVQSRPAGIVILQEEENPAHPPDAAVTAPGNSEKPESTPIPGPTPEPQHISTPKAQPGEGEKIITLSFTGDVTLGSEEVNASKENSFHGYALREGYGWFFKNMIDLFSTDDLTLVNLEGVLSDSPMMEDTRKTFRFRGPTDFARILTSSYIEACAVSNNHVMDFGRQGYESTLRTLKLYGLQFCGNERCFVFEKDGIKIAFFALGSTYFFTYAQKVQEAIAQLRREGVNAVVCSFHAGQEYASRRRDRDQERFAKIAVRDWGADLVVMHHPHVLQGIDVLDDRYVFYSLGNFCFGGNMTIRASEKDRRVRTLETMVLQMDLHFSQEGAFLGQEGRIYPCYISSSAHRVNDPNDFQPKFVTGAEAQGVIDRIQYDTGFPLEAMDEEGGYVPLPYLKAPARTEE